MISLRSNAGQYIKVHADNTASFVDINEATLWNNVPEFLLGVRALVNDPIAFTAIVPVTVQRVPGTAIT